MIILFSYLLLAIGVSFFCSISEAILLSVRPSYLETLESQKAYGYRHLKDLRDNLDRPLAAILTANTIAHTVGASGVGAQAAVVFGSQYVGITSAVLTFLILVFSEIIPKTLGATYWHRLAPAFAISVFWLTKALAPFVWLSEMLTQLISRSKTKSFTFSRDEIQATAQIGAQEGTLDPQEFNIVHNLMYLRQLTVRDIMTPRTVVFSLPANVTVEDYFAKYSDQPFSRIPIYGSDPDDLQGYVLKSDLLMAQAKDQFKSELSQFRRDLITIEARFSVSHVFDRLVYEKIHIATVIDQYGTLQGIVTLEDVVETLTGLEIMDELDQIEDMRSLAQYRWRQRMQALGIDPDQE